MREITNEEVQEVGGAGAWTAINALGTFLGNMTTFSQFGYGLGVGLYDSLH